MNPPGFDAVEKSSTDEIRADHGGFDAGVSVDEQLGAQGLIETDGGELGGAVIDKAVCAVHAGQRGHRDDVALASRQHVRQETFHRLHISKRMLGMELAWSSPQRSF